MHAFLPLPATPAEDRATMASLKQQNHSVRAIARKL